MPLPRVRHLLLSLRPALDENAAPLTAVFADHVAMALVGRMASA
jgi:hypothetical protein